MLVHMVPFYAFRSEVGLLMLMPKKYTTCLNVVVVLLFVVVCSVFVLLLF